MTTEDSVIVLTDDEVRERMRTILDTLGMTEEKMKTKAEEYLLDKEERYLYDEYMSLSWLAGLDDE